MILNGLAAQLPYVDFPDPETPAEAEKFLGGVGGVAYGIVTWLALIAIFVAFGYFILKRNSADRSEALKWLIWAIGAYIVLQSLEQVINVLNDVVTSPFDKVSGS